MADKSEGAADLSEQIKAIQAELLALTESVRSFSSEKAHAGAEALREAAGRAGDAADDARRHGEHMAEALEGRITANPLPSVLIAAGVGLVIGAMLGRR